MKVSIITAFYKGNAYMADYKQMIRANQKNLESADELEAVIINDSPEESVSCRKTVAIAISGSTTRSKTAGSMRRAYAGFLSAPVTM